MESPPARIGRFSEFCTYRESTAFLGVAFDLREPLIVCPLVICAVAALCECLVAIAAFEQFLSRMCPFVICAAGAMCECLVTVAAFERFLSRMCPFVVCAVGAV